MIAFGTFFIIICVNVVFGFIIHFQSCCMNMIVFFSEIKNVDTLLIFF